VATNPSMLRRTRPVAEIAAASAAGDIVPPAVTSASTTAATTFASGALRTYSFWAAYTSLLTTMLPSDSATGGPVSVRADGRASAAGARSEGAGGRAGEETSG